MKAFHSVVRRFNDFIVYHCPSAYALKYQLFPKRPCTSLSCVALCGDASTSKALTNSPVRILPIIQVVSSCLSPSSRAFAYATWAAPHLNHHVPCNSI